MSSHERAHRRAVFLDRDGVINIDHGYVFQQSRFNFMPGAVAAMKRLHESGYLLVVVTNQSGIARGLYSQADFEHLTRWMCNTLQDAGAPIALVLHCPHHPKGQVAPYSIGCTCRKPAPGMVLTGLKALDLRPEHCVMVGDKMSDVEAARAAGLASAYLVQSDNHCAGASAGGTVPDGRFADLADCVAHLLNNKPHAPH